MAQSISMNKDLPRILDVAVLGHFNLSMVDYDSEHIKLLKIEAVEN